MSSGSSRRRKESRRRQSISRGLAAVARRFEIDRPRWRGEVGRSATATFPDRCSTGSPRGVSQPWRDEIVCFRVATDRTPARPDRCGAQRVRIAGPVVRIDARVRRGATGAGSGGPEGGRIRGEVNRRSREAGQNRSEPGRNDRRPDHRDSEARRCGPGVGRAPASPRRDGAGLVRPANEVDRNRIEVGPTRPGGALARATGAHPKSGHAFPKSNTGAGLTTSLLFQLS